ncbi:MAG TPA: hypothetical protein VEZ11_01330 [Thermoanaerobaculia bacterium]|nr:hypothetical protein [Thermoanaerobaculia bacterium]
MKLRHLITAASIALLPLAASAGSLIVPAAGTGPGANDSHWQSELKIQNMTARAITVQILYHDAKGASAPVAVVLAPRATRTFADVVQTSFGLTAGTGAIEIQADDTVIHKLAVTSRITNVSATGEFGQDVPAVDAADAAFVGETSVIAGPSSAAQARFNFGVYAVDDATIRWELTRADGSIAAATNVDYAKGTQVQYNSGVSALLGGTPADDDSIHAVILKGSAIFYGSIVNSGSGDPTFVPGIAVREDIRINFTGVDVNEDGAIELHDADHDGVLDQPLDVFTSTFPNYFKIVASGPNGEPAVFALADSRTDVLLGSDGTVQWAPGGALKGKTDALHVRVTAGLETEVLTIPINYR